MRIIFTLLIILLSINLVQSETSCPADKAIYVSDDDNITFTATHYAMKRRLVCHDTKNKFMSSNGSLANFTLIMPPSPYWFDTLIPSRKSIETTDHNYNITCNEMGYRYTKGLADGKTVYLSEHINFKGTNTAGEWWIHEEAFLKEIERFPSEIIWLNDGMIPEQRLTIIDTTREGYYEFESEQRGLPKDVYYLKGCRK